MSDLAVVCLKKSTALEAIFDLMARSKSKVTTIRNWPTDIFVRFENGDTIMWINTPNKVIGRRFTSYITKYDDQNEKEFNRILEMTEAVHRSTIIGEEDNDVG